MLIKQLTFRILLKQVKQGVFVLLHAVYVHPAIKIYHSYQYNSIMHEQVYAVNMVTYLSNGYRCMDTAVPNIQLSVYYRIMLIAMIYFYYRVHINCMQQHKHAMFYLF